MAIVTVPMYRAVCDGEKCDASAQDGGEFWAWADSGQALDEAEAADWLTVGDKHYCAGCVEENPDLQAERQRQLDDEEDEPSMAERLGITEADLQESDRWADSQQGAGDG